MFGHWRRTKRLIRDSIFPPAKMQAPDLGWESGTVRRRKRRGRRAIIFPFGREKRECLGVNSLLPASMSFSSPLFLASGHFPSPFVFGLTPADATKVSLIVQTRLKQKMAFVLKLFSTASLFHRILCIPSTGVISVSFCHLSDVPEIARTSPLLQIRPPPITHTIIRGAITQGGKKDGDGQCFVVRGKRTGTRTDCKILLSSFFRRTESQTISKVFFWTLKLRQCFCWCDN